MTDVNNNELHVGNYVKFKDSGEFDFMNARNGVVINLEERQADGVVIEHTNGIQTWKFPYNVRLMTDDEKMLFILER